MKVISGYLLAVLLIVLCSNVRAQSKLSSIAGRVVTENHTAAEAATIVLLKSRDSSVISSAIINKGGNFSFEAVKPDSYLLLVTSVGYKKVYDGPFTLQDSQALKVPDIVLQASSNQLKEITVVSTRPDIEVRPGRIILNVQNSLIAEGNSALDILRQSPGVRVDNSNNINIVGRQNALITIDGKTTNLSGEDLANYLRSLQSNMIERIELITSASAKYDAAGGGIVNIVLKKGNNTGTNATVTATGGYGKYYKSRAGIVFNSRNNSFNVFGSYNFTDDKTFHNFTNDRIINFDNTQSGYHVDYKGLQNSTNNVFSIGTDFFLSANHTIGFLVNGFSRQDDFTKHNVLNITNQGRLDSVIIANSQLARHNTRINYNLNYNGKLGKSGATLAADINYTTSERSSSEYIKNDFFNSNLIPYRNSLLQENLSPSMIHIWLSKVDLFIPLSKTSKIETGLKYNMATSDNELVFGPNINGQYVPDPNLSNHFKYTENINAGYVNYQRNFNKVDLTLGLRSEQTIAKGNAINSSASINRDYLSLFPQVQLVYKKDSKNDFSLSYNRGITRPLYEDLNPFLYYVDLYDYRAGNPNLKPEYTNSIEFSHTYNKTFVTTAYATIINDAYDFKFYEQNDSSKVNITTQRNLGRVYNYGIKFIAPVRFYSWWNASFYVDVAYQRYVAYPENGNLNKGTQDFIFNSTQNFIISSTIAAELSGGYESPTFYGINQIRANYFVSGAISKQLFNKRASLRLNVSDIFNTLRDRGYTNYQNLNLKITDKKETQIARLTFTYHFGKMGGKTVTHRTGNEEEQKRIGSGAGN